MRVLALTADASLHVALSSMMPDLELRAVRDPSRAVIEAGDAAVALIDLGSVERGLDAARALRAGGVMIPCVVVGEGDAPEGVQERIVARPFTLSELAEAMVRAAEEGTVAQEARDAFADIAAEEEQEALPQVIETPEIAADIADLLAPSADEQDYAASLLADLDDPMPMRATAVPTIVRPRAKTPPPAEILPAVPASRRRLRRRTEVVPLKRPLPTPAATSISTRIGAAVWAARELESVLQEMPLLAEPRAVAHAFLSEVVELFGPETAAVYAPRADGCWGVLAPYRLSKIEADIPVSPDQPLFKEVAAARTGVFVSPVDLAQGLVAGIGGARTETLMAAALDAGGTCAAIVVAGGGGWWTEHDLDRLCDLASEAAPGLAFAQMVDRLRARW